VTGRRASVLATVGLLAAGCGGGFELSVGDCVRTPEDPDVVTGAAEVTVVDCDEPHELEVIHVFSPGPDEVAGDALLDAVVDECLGSAFEGYLGVPAEESEWRLLPIPPSDADLERGDRRVVCTVRPPDGGTTEGSVRAAGS
jgi:hypothetical protein